MDLEQAAREISRQSSKALNDWLAKCVSEFCPEAIQEVESGRYDLAAAMLRQAKISFRTLPDSKYEFLVVEAVVARCKIDIELTTHRDKPTASLIRGN